MTSEMREFLEILIQAVFTVLAAATSFFVIPYLKKLVEKYELQELTEFIIEQVKAAEQIYRNMPKSGKRKKEDVLENVADFCDQNKIDYDSFYINEKVEAAVFNMKNKKPGEKSNE